MRGAGALAAGLAVWVLWSGWLPRLRLVRLGWRVDRRTLIMAPFFGSVAGYLTLGFTNVGAVAVAVAVLAAAVPFLLSQQRRQRKREQAVSQFPDFLVRLRGHLSGGESVPEAFVAAASSMGGRFAAAATVAKRRMLQGQTMEEILGALATEWEEPVADRVFSVLATSHHTGGRQVGAVLSGLSSSVADELRLRAAHDAALTQQRLTALVALVAPWVLLVISVSTNPSAAAAYRSTTGSLVIGIGMVGTLLGYTLARRTARLSRAPRVLR